jgi:NitT/TauT family transport system substrate-binding protein
MRHLLDRRDTLKGLGALGTAGLWRPDRAAAREPPPETNRLRLSRHLAICLAPQYIADPLLRAEGFTEIEYITTTSNSAAGEGHVDFDMGTAAWVAAYIDKGLPITGVGGVHVGCYELFVRDDIRTLSDLKGKRVIVPILDASGHLLLITLLAHVGLDPINDIEWLTGEPGQSLLEAFVEGKSDAFLGFPPEPQELRDRGIGRVILNTATDRPWSSYFCCIAIGNSDFVAAHPVATKRYLRALLKATDLCAADPEYAAKSLIAGGFTGRLDYALQTLNEVPYDRWRDYDPEDSIRFYALRLHEVGMLEHHPNQVIEKGTDWRFFNELKQELRA